MSLDFGAVSVAGAGVSGAAAGGASIGTAALAESGADSLVLADEDELLREGAGFAAFGAVARGAGSTAAAGGVTTGGKSG